MFFIWGINSGKKEFKINQLVICERCNRYGRYQVFMTYTYLILFFIPILKWGKRYYVKMSCCNALYELNRDIGRRIAGGENLEIRPSDLNLVREGNRQNQGWSGGGAAMKRCGNCGYETTEDFEYCPKCGQKL